MTPGHPLSMFWGYVSKGVDPETGDLIYEDRNGDGEITPLDKTWIGNANPKFTFGMTNNFSWRGFNLNILITGSYGNDIFNASRIETEGMASANNQTTTVLRRWSIPGQQTDVFRSDNPVEREELVLLGGGRIVSQGEEHHVATSSRRSSNASTSRASSLTFRSRTSSPGPAIRATIPR